MLRILATLAAILFFFNSISAKVYPPDGPLFDISSPLCAVDRPVQDVLDELLAQTSFFSGENDEITIETSSGKFRTNTSSTGLILPTITSADATIYVSSCSHNYISEPYRGKDTAVVFGISFIPNTKKTDRLVHSLWVKYVYNVTSNETVNQFSTFQTEDEIAIRATRTFINDSIFSKECPLPNKTYTTSCKIDPFYYNGIKYYSNKPQNVVVKTGKNLASLYSNGQRQRIEKNVVDTYDRTEYYVGRLNYCPVFNDIYETICSKDLSYNEDTSLPNSSIDTLLVTKTWYGADSTVIQHLTVGDSSITYKDSVVYSFEKTEEKTQLITKNLYNIHGCDSTVYVNVRYINTQPVYPDKFFTPNGDGVCDLWNIENINLYSNYTVRIFNRCGKELKKYRGDFRGWDGTYNGIPLPSADYWYSITIDEIDDSQSGHFTLIR